MQTTEELLAQMEAEAQSETPVCIIDPDTRTITVPPEYQLLGVENDKRVERIYFQCPKIVGDNQDLSQDYILFINYVNANGDPDAYKIEDMQVDGDNITFSWLLEEKVTLYQGDIQISFRGIIPGDEQEDPDKNRWGTTINTDCTCLIGLKCTQQVAESNPDALAQIWAAIDELKLSGGGGTEQSGLPAGGTKGQVLVKKSDVDFDTEWKTISSSGSGGGVTPTYKNLIDPSNYVGIGYSNEEDVPNNYNVFDGHGENYIDVGSNKYIYYRIYRNNKVPEVLPLFVVVSCYGEGNTFINYYKDDNTDKSGSSVSLFKEISNQYDINGIETVNTDTVYTKGFVRFEIPDGTKSVKFSIATYSNCITSLYPALWVSFEQITNYGSIIENDLLPVLGGEAGSGGQPNEGETNVSNYKPLLNKTVYFIGDSLTNWGGGGDISDGFLKVIHDRTGASMVNKGLAGATWEEADGQTEPGVKRVDEYIEADIKYDCICFLLGTNVSNQGTVDDTSETKATMCGAIKYCLEKLISYSPTTPILVFLPPQRAEGNSEQKQRNELIKQICEIYSVKTKDLYSESQIIPNTVVEGNDNLSDGLHFNVNGYTNAGRVMTSAILDVMGY